MAQSANAVITKARAMYGRMLSSAQYDELLRKQSVQEISSYLKDKTTYGSALVGVQDSTVHRGQLENLLHKDMFYQYIRMIKYVRRNDGIYAYIIADMEIELILTCLREIISVKEEDFIAGLPAFMQPYACFNIFNLINVKSVEQMADVLKNTPYEAVMRRCMQANPPDVNRINYTAYEVALRTYYFEMLLAQVRRRAHGKGAQQLNHLITLRAELMNIQTIYRLKMYFHASPDQIRSAVLPVFGKLCKRKMDALIDTRDVQSFMQLLSKTGYGRIIDPGVTFIENSTDNHRYHVYLKMLHFSTDPQVVFMAFMLLRGMETENIIRIIEGVRYGLAPEKIEKLLYRAR